ncbi:5358_t:CDS:2 [Ambispora leptoticha]|uniref:5358_t:CDS:1 n=1 Tax=Ambispora leptoticha TaxID=144679 RepID=A0A9N8W9T9_9GLOM|nr:5358_t:CDS:2 [Ambispora leptoticha]
MTSNVEATSNIRLKISQRDRLNPHICKIFDVLFTITTLGLMNIDGILNGQFFWPWKSSRLKIDGRFLLEKSNS